MEIVAKEIWRTVIFNGEIYENYMVSNLGRVKSLNYLRTGKEKILKSGEDKGNYLYVVLYKYGKQKTYRVHRLVAEAFIPKIEGKEFVDHIDGNRLNNIYTNLRWCTNKENCNFELARKHKSEVTKGEKNSMYGKHHTKETKRKMREANSKKVLCAELNKVFESTREAERELGIDHASINKCCNGKLQSAGKLNGNKLHWKYVN